MPLDLAPIRALLDIHMGRGSSKAALHAHILAYEHLIPAVLSEVDRLAPDAGRWAGLREAVRTVCMGMGHELPQADDDLAVLVANALQFTATAPRTGLVDGPPLAWRKDDAGWGLVVVLPQGPSSLGDVMRIDALGEWRWAIHEPFDHGYVGSPEEALKEMRKRLPGWKIPDMPVELLHFPGASQCP